MSYYNYHCDNCGVITLDLKFGTAKEVEICPICSCKVKRIYSPTASLWMCDGAFGKSVK